MRVTTQQRMALSPHTPLSVQVGLRERGARGGRGPQLSGFSLIEVLCAILVLGIALAGLTHGISTALVSSKESEVQTTAALIAAGQLEALRAEGGLIDGETEGECGEALSLYRWKQTISKSSIDGLHEVLVVVENSKSGKSVYELRTLLFEPTEEPIPKESSKRKSGKSGKKGRERS